MDQQSQTEYKYIDLKKSIRESKSKLLKRLPGFIVKWLVKVVREDDLNRVLNKYSHCVGREFLENMLVEFNLTLQIEGQENLPEKGKCLYIANHPFGVIDGLILTYIVSGKYGDLKAIANEVFMMIPHLHPFIAAVDVFNGSSKAYLQAVGDVYNSDIPITHFPAGKVSRVKWGKVQDLPWHKSFVTKSVTSKRDIVPLYFFGRNSRLFYAIYVIRRMFGIKLNIELMLLPREMFRKQNSTIRVKIGKPIPYQTFDKSKSHWEWTQEVRSRLYGLGKN